MNRRSEIISHRGYGLEWWYWVGHLEAVEGGAEFGFQSTVFAWLIPKIQSKLLVLFGNRQSISLTVHW